MNINLILSFCLGISLFLIKIVGSQLTSDIDELLNWCIDAKHHKSKPGPESSLYGQCTPWKNRSCCTEETTRDLHEESLYSFNFDHCPNKKTLSSKCKSHFMQDHCFYECSPNVGPWTVKEQRSWRKERYYKVPLCESDCTSWFKDCIDDYTCTDNWSRNFLWIDSTDTTICKDRIKCKTNICPAGSKCETFGEIFKESKNFCERVWDDSWEVTDDSQYCMRIWFNGSTGNPNDKVAAWKASTLSSSNWTQPSGFSLFSLACLTLFHFYNSFSS